MISRVARRAGLLGVVCAAGLMAAGSALSQPASQAVDLELVLAVDVSASMDEEEQGVQRRGYAEAFRHPSIISAIRNGATGRIAVAYLEWAEQANITVPWTIIANDRDARAFAARLEAEPIYSARRTSISNALATAGAMFEANSVQGGRRVIDISGDGANNAGAPVEVARDAVVGRGIVINGLPVMLNKPPQWYDIPNLEKYYKDCVVGGRGAFVLPVRSLDELASTIRSKMVTEIADLAPREGGFIYAQARVRPAQAKADCMVGEKNWGGGPGPGRFDFNDRGGTAPPRRN